MRWPPSSIANKKIFKNLSVSDVDGLRFSVADVEL